MCDVRALCGGAPPPYALPNTAGTSGQVMTWPASPGVPLQLVWGAGGGNVLVDTLTLTITESSLGIGGGGTTTMTGELYQSVAILTAVLVAASGSVTISTGGSGQLSSQAGAIPARYRPANQATSSGLVEATGAGDNPTAIYLDSSGTFIFAPTTSGSGYTVLATRWNSLLVVSLYTFTMSWSTSSTVGQQTEVPRSTLATPSLTESAELLDALDDFE